MSTSDPKTTVRQARYQQANREVIRDPAVIEEFDRLAAFLLGTQQGMGQRDVERDLDYGFDRPPSFEFPAQALDFESSKILFDAVESAAYAATYTSLIAMGQTDADAKTAATAAGTAARAAATGDVLGTSSDAGRTNESDTSAEGDAGSDAGNAGNSGNRDTRPSKPPVYNHGDLGPDPGSPEVFENMLTWVAIANPGVPDFIDGDVAFCPIEGKFILAGRQSGAGKVWQSSDALTWEELVVPYAVGAGGFVGVKGIDLTVDRGRVVLVSVNRVYEKDVDDVWTELNPTDFLDCTGLGYLSGVGFCALTSYLGSPTAQLSADGYTWNITSAQPVAGTKIRSGGGYLLRLGSAGVSLSADGDTWSSASPGVGFGAAFTDVTYHNSLGVWFGVWPAFTSDPTQIWKSTDATGEVWSVVYEFNDTSGSPIGAQALIYDPVSNKLILSTYYDLFYESSDGGVTWVAQDAPASSIDASRSCVGNGVVVITSDDYIFVGSVTE